MNIVVEKLPKCVATLRVEIPTDTVQGQRKIIVNTYLSKARIPGFRPGKAPLAIIEKRFEKEIAEELHEKLAHQAYDAALEQENLKVIDFGLPQDLTTQPDGSITFASKITLAPDVQLPEYKGVTVTVPALAVPDADLQAQLRNLQERFAEFNDIVDRPAAMDDLAVLDYTSTVDGKPTEEFLGKSAGYLSNREDYWVRMDDKAFLPGFATQLVGMNPGDAREITLTLPADFPVEALQNQVMVFQTTLKQLKQSILPELNDEFAARLMPGGSLDGLSDFLRNNMQEERKRKIEDMKVDQIVAHFNAQVDFELPEDLITQETQSQADAMVRRGVQAGMSEEEIESQQSEIFANAGHQAVSSLRSNFILQEIARVENITVADGELVSHLVQIANSRKVAPKKFIKDMQRAGRLPSIRNSITIGKVIDFLVEHAEVLESAEAAITED